MQTGQLLSSITAAAASKELTAMMLDIFGLWKRGFQSKMKHGNYDLLAAQVWAVALQQAQVTEHEIGAAYAESIKTFLSRLCGGEDNSLLHSPFQLFLSRLCGGEGTFLITTAFLFFSKPPVWR